MLDELASSNRKDIGRLLAFFVSDDRQGLMELAHGIKGGAMHH